LIPALDRHPAARLRRVRHRGRRRHPAAAHDQRHSFDDIPTICGLAADPDRIAELAREKIEIHPARAALSFAPLLDFSGLVRRNLARRVRTILGRRQAASGTRPSDGLVLVGYGSTEFEDEWNRFFAEARGFAEADLGIGATAHAWCGHIVRYRRQPTIDAIEAVLERADRSPGACWKRSPPDRRAGFSDRCGGRLVRSRSQRRPSSTSGPTSHRC
jgi:hypothetical protein